MYNIGIDLGGTNIKVGLVDENYNIVAKATAKTAYSFTVQDGYTLSAITVNGAALTAGTDYTANGTTYTIAAEKVTGAIVIAVTSNP
jgi:glucokinase